jgi:hypothetical protein
LAAFFLAGISGQQICMPWYRVPDVGYSRFAQDLP